MSDYEVGYRKPPRSGRIRPGEVRNPFGRAGRKPGAISAPGLDEAGLLERIAGEPVSIDGRVMTRREASVRTRYMSALKGKGSAIRYIDRLSADAGAEANGGRVLHLPCDDFEKWNTEDAMRQKDARLKQERRNMRRRRRRAGAKQDAGAMPALKSEREIFLDIEEEALEREGKQISMRELRLRMFVAHAAKGNQAAQAAIARIEAAARMPEGRRPGYLVVPETPTLEIWAVAAAKQQARYRTQSVCDEDFPESGP
ncbi:hypothetical protein SAMIE_1023650 [Sphingobium amiense]|uniref:DUF5681 domain-containing protein n=1 Tax=Sphingobium amiense TaxID=135719 RepID=A0A494W2K8_9SPHN|nr:hypothetical protein [Sphingobium amiense]BBD98864.1 hypothetical protein SAMIE_1023650 [Sphingobium amiense]